MATPLITPIKNNGGTFFTFPSASEDFNLSMSSANKELKFSKFVLLDLPNIKDGGSGVNVTGIEHIPSSYLKIDASSPNTAFIESFQNYAFNMETLLTSKSGYDSTKNKTVSERVFWKWLKEIGAIRFREAEVGNPEDGGERTRRTEDNITNSNVSKRAEIGKRFVEENETTTVDGDKFPYSHIVKYIGNVDAVNGVKYLGTSYNQIYVHIPSSVGKTPKVLFKSITDDTNYTSGMILTNEPIDPLNKEYLVGRKYNDTHPVGLDLRAHYDSDNNTFINGTPGVDAYSLSIKKPGEQSYTNGWWYSSPNANSYLTEPSTLQDYRNDWMKITGHRDSVANNKEFIRSRLDGIEIDFNLATSYSDNLSNKYKSWEDYNKSELTGDFEYNAILLYYDLIDKTDPSKNVTNLFGVYFLDNWEDTLTDGYKIPKIKKYKPSTITRQNGNAFAYNINLMLDLNSNDAVTVTSVNEYNTYSLHLYNAALENVKKSHDLLISNIAKIDLLNAKIDTLEGLINDSVTLEDLNERIDTLENSLSESQSLISDVSGILQLIDRNYTEVTNIYKNLTSVEMSYNLDVIRPGRGIIIDKTIPGIVRIKNNNEGYAIGKTPIIKWDDFQYKSETNTFYYVHNLIDGHNWLKVYYDELVEDSSIDLDVRTLTFYINDNVLWEKGQSMKIIFGQKFEFDLTSNYAVEILTDVNNKMKNETPYTIQIGKIKPSELGKGGEIFEIVCLDSVNYKFDLHKLK